MSHDTHLYRFLVCIEKISSTKRDTIAGLVEAFQAWSKKHPDALPPCIEFKSTSDLNIRDATFVQSSRIDLKSEWYSNKQICVYDDTAVFCYSQEVIINCLSDFKFLRSMLILFELVQYFFDIGQEHQLSTTKFQAIIMYPTRADFLSTIEYEMAIPSAVLREWSDERIYVYNTSTGIQTVCNRKDLMNILTYCLDLKT